LTVGLNSVAYSHTAINRPQIGQKRKREIEMDQLRWKRESRSACVTRPGECAHARTAVATTVAATAQVKVHWGKRELTMTRVLRVYIETTQTRSDVNASIARLHQ